MPRSSTSWVGRSGVTNLLGEVADGDAVLHYGRSSPREDAPTESGTAGRASLLDRFKRWRTRWHARSGRAPQPYSSPDGNSTLSSAPPSSASPPSTHRTPASASRVITPT